MSPIVLLVVLQEVQHGRVASGWAPSALFWAAVASSKVEVGILPGGGEGGGTRRTERKGPSSMGAWKLSCSHAC